MEVKIGIQSAPRELVVETTSSEEQVESALEAAVADDGVFALAATNGGKILVPASKIAYVELGVSENRRVGFGG